MAIFSHHQKHPALVFFSPSLFPSVFAANKIFFSSFRDLLLRLWGGSRFRLSRARPRGVSQRPKRKKTKKYTTRARAKRRKRRSDQTRGNVFYSFSLSLSLSLSLYVCVYFIITKRELKMVSNYIFYAYVATTPASFSTAGIRNPSVRDRSALSSLRGAKSRKRRRCTQKLTSLSTRRLL